MVGSEYGYDSESTQDHKQGLEMFSACMCNCVKGYSSRRDRRQFGNIPVLVLVVTQEKNILKNYSEVKLNV